MLIHDDPVPLTSLPRENRPRERISSGGAERLSDTDLISVILGSGVRGRPVHEIAGEIITLFDGRNGVPGMTELQRVRGVGPAKAAVISASMEFARRRLKPTGRRIEKPSDALPAVVHYSDRLQEHFLCLSLNGAHEILKVRVVSVGLLNRAIVHPREVFAGPLTDRAAAVIVAHNHPSGTLTPSSEDVEVTRRLKEAGEILGVPLLDHIVFSGDRYHSFLENGAL